MPRNLARITHIGDPCVKCGGTWRYNSENKCVYCVRARQILAAHRKKVENLLNIPLARNREELIMSADYSDKAYENIPAPQASLP